MKRTKAQVVKEIKDAIKDNILCGNAYYCVVFNNDKEDYMIVDEYSINDEVMSEEQLNILKSKSRQITEISFWDGGCYPHEDEILYKAA